MDRNHQLYAGTSGAAAAEDARMPRRTPAAADSARRSISLMHRPFRLPSLRNWQRPEYHRSFWAGPTLAIFMTLALLYTWAAPVYPHAAP